MAFEDRRKLAEKVLEVLELTHLADGSTEQDILSLCERARTPFGDVAAVCVPSRFVSLARDALRGSRVAVATVANWPRGRSKVDYVAAEAEIAFFEGADEVNVVLPWRSVKSRDPRTPASMVEECARQPNRKQFIKVTLEAGELDTEELVREAARNAMDCGAEFLETATGKTDNRARVEHARMILEEIRNHRVDGGFKAGHMASLEDCRIHLELAAEIMGEDWITADNFRLGGGTEVLDEVIAILERESAGA